MPIMPRAEDGIGVEATEDSIVSEEVVAEQANRLTPGGWQAVPRLKAVGASSRRDAPQSAGARWPPGIQALLLIRGFRAALDLIGDIDPLELFIASFDSVTLG